ncbi:disks large-associated protein 2 isoform X1 [Clupea harengus]|uniref:Disks large-associated protein 2 isoform X1 n=1 Tax=Clupea harengus TaxID=7950 RepID=A0A6P8GDA9_CLUHA|nr:disks large-associated protein 2 isoform X1 [Clupea harengus]
MKSLPGGRPQYPFPPIHTHDPRYTPYLLSPTEGSFPLDAHVSPRTSLHSDCLVMAPGLLPPSAALPAEHVSSSTFPRMHYSSQYYNSIPREDCVALTPTVAHAPMSFSSSGVTHHHQQQHHHYGNALSGHHGNPRGNRLQSGLMDQMEKQRPVQREGFHTLQYQRGTGESPGRIRHLVHSVQKLFTKSHSLEGKANGSRTDSMHHQHHHSSSTSSKHGGSGKRSKSKERRHRSSGDWWSSDDNLDSDGTFRTHGMLRARQQAVASEHAVQHCPPLEHTSGHFGRLSLKTSKSSGDIKCSACKGAPPDGKFLKRSSWSTLTVSQAKEAYRKSSLNLDKPSSLHHEHMGHRLHHYLQVPGDEWSGYPGDRDEEIPCRRMRSSSYVKAMGDEESAGESDTSPKSSPQKAVRPDALVLKSAIQRPHLDPQSQGYHLQTSRDMRPLPSVNLDPPTSYHPPPYRSRNQSYMRAVSTLSQASCVSQGKHQSERENGRGKTKDCYSCFCLSGIQFRLPTACSVDRTQPAPSGVSCPPSVKRTPPQVPPRSMTRPIISVTAQSSTESMPDTQPEAELGLTEGVRGMRGAMGHLPSGLDSGKAMAIAMETAAGKRLLSTGSQGSIQTCDKAVLVSKAEEYLKTPRSSVGIQVETATDSESERRGLPQYHSVGIQVEDFKRHGRFKRSNSVTTAVQADLELEGFPSMEDKGLQFGGFHSEPTTPTQYGALRTVRTQGLFSYREDNRPPSPQTPAWLAETTGAEGAARAEAGSVSPLRRDGNWFVQLLEEESRRLEDWCREMEQEAEEQQLTEDILGKIRSAVGSAQLLMSQKFQQFYWLCQQNLDPSAMPRPTSQDLAGFWDLLQLSIEDVSAKFQELQQIRGNEWKPLESPEKKAGKWPPPAPRRPSRGRGAMMRDRSLDLQDRQRQDARRRLLAAKRAASFRQSSVTERGDSIEIYIPEAQTRL